MKKMMMVCVMLLLIAGCADDQVATDQGIVVLHHEYVEPGTDEPFNGERIIHNDSLNLRQKAQYVDGYPEEVIYYYPNQQEKTKIVVADDGRGEVTTHTEWYESGQKKFEHHNYTLREWHENGQLKAEVPYDENGDLHGIAKTWDEEGNLNGEEEYEQGKLVESS